MPISGAVRWGGGWESRMAKKRAKSDRSRYLGEIRPEALYPIEVALKRLGIGPDLRRELDRQNLFAKLETIDLGRYKYVRGADLILWVEDSAYWYRPRP